MTRAFPAPSVCLLLPSLALAEGTTDPPPFERDPVPGGVAIVDLGVQRTTSPPTELLEQRTPAVTGFGDRWHAATGIEPSTLAGRLGFSVTEPDGSTRTQSTDAEALPGTASGRRERWHRYRGTRTHAGGGSRWPGPSIPESTSSTATRGFSSMGSDCRPSMSIRVAPVSRPGGAGRPATPSARSVQPVASPAHLCTGRSERLPGRSPAGSEDETALNSRRPIVA